MKKTIENRESTIIMQFTNILLLLLQIGRQEKMTLVIYIFLPIHVNLILQKGH